MGFDGIEPGWQEEVDDSRKDRLLESSANIVAYDVHFHYTIMSSILLPAYLKELTRPSSPPTLKISASFVIFGTPGAYVRNSEITAPLLHTTKWQTN
jgi:hypothetical protein